MISTGVIWICFFVFNFLFDIRERPENAIKTSESGRVCKYATPESEQMKAKGYRTSISPAKKNYGRTSLALWTYVQRVLARTAWGVEDVRPEGAWTYVQGTFEPCRTELNDLLNEILHKRRFFMQYLSHIFFQIVWDGRHFSNVKMSFCLRVRVTQNHRGRYQWFAINEPTNVSVPMNRLGPNGCGHQGGYCRGWRIDHGRCAWASVSGNFPLHWLIFLENFLHISRIYAKFA